MNTFGASDQTKKNMSAIASPKFHSTGSTVLTLSTSALPLNGDFDVLKISFQEAGNMMHGNCQFGQEFVSLIPLFRGLILLGKPKTLSLIYDHLNSKVFFTCSLGEKKEVELFFEKISKLLKSEIRFKKLLAQIIASMKRFQAEQQLMHKALHQKNWD